MPTSRRTPRLTYELMASAVNGIRISMDLPIAQFTVRRVNRQLYAAYLKEVGESQVLFAGGCIDMIEWLGNGLKLPQDYEEDREAGRS